jgi:GH15 family glucan-1,4-alpha-glucosidase
LFFMTRLSVSSSVQLLASAQTSTGAIPASTVHDVYQYGWLRDGSWCAYALDRAGRRDAASAWHHWVAQTVLAHEHRVDQAIAAVREGRVTGLVMMPARFTLDGQEEIAGEEEWPNYQTDCYGFWLWAVADHIRRGGVLDDQLEAAMRLTIRYLLAAGDQPCYDCWEEHPATATPPRWPRSRPACVTRERCSTMPPPR